MKIDDEGSLPNRGRLYRSSEISFLLSEVVRKRTFHYFMSTIGGVACKIPSFRLGLDAWHALPLEIQ